MIKTSLTIANTNNKIIYIPTEAGLPVLEAGRTAKEEN